MANEDLHYKVNFDSLTVEKMALRLGFILPLCFVSVTALADSTFTLSDGSKADVKTEIGSTWFPIKSTIIGDFYAGERYEVVE